MRSSSASKPAARLPRRRPEEHMAAAPAATTCELQPLGGGRFALSGELGFTTVTALLERSRALFGGAPVVKIDLSGVRQADSAGLALLLEWINEARRARREIRYFNLPAQLRAIARISEVEEILQAVERL